MAEEIMSDRDGVNAPNLERGEGGEGRTPRPEDPPAPPRSPRPGRTYPRTEPLHYPQPTTPKESTP